MTVDTEGLAWAWGVNGIFSVLAPIAGVGVSMTWGISALLLSAIPAYLVAVFVVPAGEPPVPGGAAPSA